MSKIKYPEIAIYLGRAAELDGDQWVWTWTKKDNFALVSDMEPNTGLYIFGVKKFRLEPQSPSKRASKLYTKFNRRYPDQCYWTSAPAATELVGRANYIVYESDKFGAKKKYIHEFESKPKIYVDNPRKPRMLALLGGKIEITKRGIEG